MTKETKETGIKQKAAGPKPSRIEGVRQKTAGSSKAQLVSTLEQEAALPIAATLNEFLLTQRPFIGAVVGNGGADYRAQTFHMSGGGCDRKELLDWAGVKKLPENPTSLRRFATGHLVENLLEKAVDWKGMLVASQLKVWRDWAFRPGRGHKYDPPFETSAKLDLSDCLVSGTLDAILAWKRGKVWRVFIVDWKTVDIRRFFKVDQAIDPGYATQLASYAVTAEAQHGPAIREKLEKMGVERDPKGPLFDGARLIYASVGGPIQIAQVGVDLDVWVPRAWERWKRVRIAAEAYIDGKAVPAELEFNEKGEPPWNCNPLYCRFAMARYPDGVLVCPKVGAFWAGRVQEAIAKGRDAEWPGRALRMAEIMHKVEDEARAEEAVLLGASPEALDAEASAAAKLEAERQKIETDEPPEPPEPGSGAKEG